MGLGLYFETGEGPRFKKVVSSAADIDALPIPDPDRYPGLRDGRRAHHPPRTQFVPRLAASSPASATGNGHVFNLGHGITPEVDPAHAGAFIEAVHELSVQYHR
ncbi:Uroporphyrinogen decarboxylase [Stutzerimonas stutzeri]